MLPEWIKNPRVYFTNKRGNQMIPQGVGMLTDYKLDQILKEPALFKCLTTATGNVNVVYYDGSTEIIDCQELDRLNMLIKQIKTTSTTTSLSDIKLEV
jgi:hypothetical protein